MASLFTIFGRIISGKPVFDPNDASSQNTQGQATSAPTTPGVPVSTFRKGVASGYPVVQVKHVDTRLSGNTMQVYCYLLNSSPEPLVLDKIQLLGLTRRLQDDLRPNEEREYLVYTGPTPQTDQQREVLLDYKTTSGDYFESVYEIIYAYHQEDKTYTIGDLHLVPPIRDIYG